MRAVWVGFLFGLAGLSAMAAPPDQSPRPLPRPVAATVPAAPAAIAGGLALSPRPLARPAAMARAITPDPGLPVLTADLPRPKPRPAFLQVAVAPVPDAAPEAPVARTRLILPRLARQAPPARPDDFGKVVTLAAFVPTQPLETITTGKKGSVCGARAIRGKTIPPIAAKLKGCGLKDGVEITSVAGVGLSTPVVTDCQTALSLKDWVEGAVVPAVGRKGGGVARLEIAASYVCRPRNNQKGNRISEHGKGRAVDVSAIVLADGTAISVLKDWGKGKGGKVLKAIRAAACGPFTTVLGPGSDRFHRDHLHLDTARGRGTWCR